VSGSIAGWKKAIEEWEKDPTCPNPFEFQGKGTKQPLTLRLIIIFHIAVSLASVKLKLLQKEAEEIQQSPTSMLDGAISHSVLISMGLELEEQQ
jgi:hypothetical protein